MLAKLGFDLPFDTHEEFYFECQVQLDSKPVTEVSFSGTIKTINNALNSIKSKAWENHMKLAIISPKLVEALTGDMVPKKRYTVVY